MRNTFRPDEDDVGDMLRAVARLARRGRTTLADARLEYLAVEFRRRHIDIWKQWQEGSLPAPVSERRFRRIIREHEEFSAAVRENMPGFEDRPSARRLRALGPGEIYELDATGGQIFVVDRSDPSKVLAKVYFYLLIDRWSRYIPALYLTLQPPSSDHVRATLRIAFSPRSDRFKSLGYLNAKSRWPAGVVPAAIAVDRGAEMISEETLLRAVDGLRVEPLVLPPQTPDGKAIVERVIRTLKDMIRHRGTKGTYPKWQRSPEDKAKARNARQVAVYDLRSLYRVALEVLDEYNHRPHRTLERCAELVSAGIPPTPVEAYQWGLENITGIRRPPLPLGDYLRLTLSKDAATRVGRTLHYQSQAYFPQNQEAVQASRRSSPEKISVLVDRADPSVLYSGRDGNAEWKICDAGAHFYRGMLPEEQDALRDAHNLVSALARDKSDRERASARTFKNDPPHRIATPPPQGAARVEVGSMAESESLEQEIFSSRKRAKEKRAPAEKELLDAAAALDAAEQAHTLERTNRRR